MTVDASRSGFNQLRWRSLHRSASDGCLFRDARCLRVPRSPPLPRQEDVVDQAKDRPLAGIHRNDRMKDKPWPFSSTRRDEVSCIASTWRPATWTQVRSSAAVIISPDRYFGIVPETARSASRRRGLPPSWPDTDPLAAIRRQDAHTKRPPFCQPFVAEQPQPHFHGHLPQGESRR